MKIIIKIVLFITLTSCVGGGGGSQYSASKSINAGDTILIYCEIYEYGNANVDKSIQPVFTSYKINTGNSVKFLMNAQHKTIKGKSIYEYSLDTKYLNLKSGDLITTVFAYSWYGRRESRTETTVVK